MSDWCYDTAMDIHTKVSTNIQHMTSQGHHNDVTTWLTSNQPIQTQVKIENFVKSKKYNLAGFWRVGKETTFLTNSVSFKNIELQF